MATLLSRNFISISMGPSVWNSPPDSSQNPVIGINCFRQSLKTFLFAMYWCIQRNRGFTMMGYINRLCTYLLTIQLLSWQQTSVIWQHFAFLLWVLNVSQKFHFSYRKFISQELTAVLWRQQYNKVVSWNSSAAFCGPLTKNTDLIMADIHDRNFVKIWKIDIISVIYDNYKNSICNSVTSCRHIIHTEFHQNQT